MVERKKPRISVRKAPRQARSTQLVTDILDAAGRVLIEEGAHRFTTARVAERAGVSIGSLYQYFPNKAAILFRLQTDEWKQNGALMRSILEDRSLAPRGRLRRLVHSFIRSEREEAEMRIALGDAAPFYRDAPEAHEPRISGSDIIRDFMAELLPGTPAARREIAGNVIMMMLGDIGKRLSEDAALASEIDRYADAVADMFAAYLGQLHEERPVSGVNVRVTPSSARHRSVCAVRRGSARRPFRSRSRLLGRPRRPRDRYRPARRRRGR